jgi:hypothetical protein
MLCFLHLRYFMRFSKANFEESERVETSKLPNFRETIPFLTYSRRQTSLLFLLL